jgi:fluoride exporter
MSVAGWIAVGLLGGIAAALRFLVDFEIRERAGGEFPLGILVVNLSGALVLGIVAGTALHGEALVIVAGGGIGSFTTFSTWILDSHRLDAAGLTRLAQLNVAVSIIAGFAAVTLGHALGTLL